MTVNQAKFTINATPSEDPATGDRLYQATINEVLTLTLEVSPSSVTRATYYVYDPTVPDSPLASMSAPLLTFAGSGSSSDSPASPNGSVTVQMPAAAAHSYNIRCIVATAEGQEEFVRQAAVPYTLGAQDIAKTTPEETIEYFARTWSDKFNQYLDYIALFTLVGLDDAYDKGGAGLGNFITADAGPVTITVPDTSGNAGLIITQSDVTGNPNALEVSNAGTGNSIELQGAGNRGIVSDENMNLTLSANSVGNHWLKIVSSNIGAGAAHIDIDADEDIDIDSRSGHISLDATVASNFKVNGSAEDLTLEVAGGGAQQLILNSAGTGTGAIDMNATGGGIEIDALTGISVDAHATSNFAVNGSGEHMTVECFGGGAQRLNLWSAGTGVDAIFIDATAGSVDIDSEKATTINAKTTSNFSVTTSGNHMTVECFGGGAQRLMLTSAGTEAAAAGIGAIDITASAGGIAIDAVKASHFIVSGATADLTFNARAGTAITLNELGQTALSGTFAATSIIGALNEAMAAVVAEDLWDRAGTVLTTHNAGDTIDINAVGTGITLDSNKTSNLTVTGSAENLALAVVGGGAQKLTLDSAGTGVDAIDITSSAGGIELNAALGVKVIGGILEMTAGGTISTTGNADLIFLPNGSGISKFGDAGACTLAGPTNDDVCVTGRQQVLGAAYIGGILNTQSIAVAVNQALYSAGATGSLLLGNHYQTVNTISLNVGTDSNSLLITQTGDYAFDFQQVQRVNPTIIIQSANQSLTEWRSSAHNQVNAFDEIGSGSMVTEHQAPTELADDGSFDLPANSAGFGRIMVADGEEFTCFRWTSAEVMTIWDNSANVVTTDTDTKFCLFDGTGKITVRNRLGAAKKVVYEYRYFTP